MCYLGGLRLAKGFGEHHLQRCKFNYSHLEAEKWHLGRGRDGVIAAANLSSRILFLSPQTAGNVIGAIALAAFFRTIYDSLLARKNSYPASFSHLCNHLHASACYHKLRPPPFLLS